MSGGTSGVATFQVLPASQVIGRGVAATFTITLLPIGTNASLRYVFSVTDSGGGAMLYADGQSPEIENGSPSTTFHAANNTNGTYTLTITPPSSLGGAPVNVTLIVGRDWTLTPSSQSAVSGTPTGNYTIALANGDVAPSGGFAFGLATSAASGGSFSTGTTATIPAGANSVTFTYTGTSVETDTLTITPPGSSSGLPQTVKTVQAVITAAAPPPPPPVSFSLSPASQSATTGSASGLITLTLSSAAPTGGLTFGLSTDETSGGSFSAGSSVTVPAGQTSATITYTSPYDGTYHLTVTPPSSGVSGGAQSVAVTFSTPVVVVPPPPPPAAPVSSSGVEVDIRCYNADGTRRAMPPVDEINFEIAEQGGMQTGSLQMLVPWEQTGWTGTEYIDVYLWGQLLYRGYVRQPQQELSSPERSSPTLHGLMELLNGYQVRRDFYYAPAASPSVLFADLCALYVTRTGRMPALVLDTTGVDALGISLWGMQATGKSVPQALNSLCELFPQQLIWGCDVDAYGRNRLYLRPRATSVKYVFAVGDKVSAFVYPQDCTQIVNRIFITGAKFDGTQGTNPANANLLPNASFEAGAPNDEQDGNRLQNGDFEEIDTYGTTDAWNLSGSSLANGTGRSGNGISIGAGHSCYQDIPLGGVPTGVHAAAWWGANAGATFAYQVKFELYDASNTLLASAYQTPQSVAGDPVGNTFKHYTYDWTPPSGIAATYLRVIFAVASASANVILDDTSVWFDGATQAQGWWASKSVNGGFAALDWRNRDITPYDGDVLVKAVVNVGSGGYGEISTRHKDRPQGQPSRAYLLAFWVYTPFAQGALHCAVGARIVQSNTLKSTVTGTTQVTNPGAWTQIVYRFNSTANCDAIEPFVRFYDSGTYYVDAAGLWLDVTSAPADYVPADTFTAMRDTGMFTQAQIGAAAYSLTNWGEREADVSCDNVTDSTDADAYAIGYFKAKAVPQVQAKLSLKGATAPIGLDGQVRLVNLPQAPPALTPARVHYQIGGSIDIDVDLENEKPQLENLLRLVAAGKA